MTDGWIWAWLVACCVLLGLGVWTWVESSYRPALQHPSEVTVTTTVTIG